MRTQPDSAGPQSVLELWHPTGAPVHRAGFGGAAPARDAGAGADGLDFVLVAPVRAEWSRRWLEQAVTRATSRLQPDGLLCVVVPRRSRHVAARLIRRAGLTQTGTLLMVPPWPRSAHVLSLDPSAVLHAGTRHMRLHPAAARCAAAVVRTEPGRALASHAAPGCALLAARRGVPEPLQWLAAVDGSSGPCAATVTTGCRDNEQVAVVLRFSPAHSRPDLVAKVALGAGGRARVERERAALAALAPGARCANAAVPAIVAEPAAGLLATTALPGASAGVLLARASDRAAAVLTAVVAWLRDWRAATAVRRVARADRLHRLLIAPADRLAATGEAKMTSYASALRSLAARLEGRTVVLAAAHNDLTMSNVLVAGARIGIVDWESASSAAPPLSDLWYALADGVARAGRMSHAQAVDALARRAAPISAALAAAPDQGARELGLSADEALLSFHACWLHHAANELDRGNPGGPFGAVVRAVAAARLQWPADERGPA